MTSSIEWTQAQVDALRNQWTAEHMADPATIPWKLWPLCIAARCTNRCSLRLLSKLCDPCTKRAFMEKEGLGPEDMHRSPEDISTMRGTDR
jgi:hypothetical protein